MATLTERPGIPRASHSLAIARAWSFALEYSAACVAVALACARVFGAARIAKNPIASGKAATKNLLGTNFCVVSLFMTSSGAANSDLRHISSHNAAPGMFLKNLFQISEILHSIPGLTRRRRAITIGAIPSRERTVTEFFALRSCLSRDKML